MSGLNNWITQRGRTSRGQFWLRSLLLWLGFYGLWQVLEPLAGSFAAWLINLPMLYLLLSLCVRRLHDRNFSGWWLLSVLLPVVGAAWLVWQLALRRGIDQANRWGEDPLKVAGDYLTVQ